MLETCQRNSTEITPWLRWFLTMLEDAIQMAMAKIARTLAKSRFWQQHQQSELSAEQIKVLNRLLEGGNQGFATGISAAQYQKVANVSKSTATRHLTELLAKKCIEKLPGGGRSTRYQLKFPDA